MVAILNKIPKITSEQLFMISILGVNGGNYLYNLILGRLLGPEKFADAAILITFLLALSFVAMTFQLVTAKFSVLLESKLINGFITRIYKNALCFGIGLGTLIVFFSKQLQILLHTSSSTMFVIFGIGTPLYFIMSVNRGVYQGNKKNKKLSYTYLSEMLSRLVFTIALLLLLKIESSVIIAIGIFISFVFGMYPNRINLLKFKGVVVIDEFKNKEIRLFFILTAFYEFTQIIINNSDIILVKHYFEAYEAGLYASLALIGRLVYFVAWMFVILLLPKVVQLKKEGKETAGVLFKYVTYIFVISFCIVSLCNIFPETIVQLLFGPSYISIAPLLWKYALATSLFAISNIFAYYYLSLDRYMPVILSGLFGLIQIALVIIYHETINQVINMQIITMMLLLSFQVFFFIIDSKNN